MSNLIDENKTTFVISNDLQVRQSPFLIQYWWLIFDSKCHRLFVLGLFYCGQLWVPMGCVCRQGRQPASCWVFGRMSLIFRTLFLCFFSYCVELYEVSCSNVRGYHWELMQAHIKIISSLVKKRQVKYNFVISSSYLFKSI